MEQSAILLCPFSDHPITRFFECVVEHIVHLAEDVFLGHLWCHLPASEKTGKSIISPSTMKFFQRTDERAKVVDTVGNFLLFFTHLFRSCVKKVFFIVALRPTAQGTLTPQEGNTSIGARFYFVEKERQHHLVLGKKNEKPLLYAIFFMVSKLRAVDNITTNKKFRENRNCLFFSSYLFYKAYGEKRGGRDVRFYSYARPGLLRGFGSY